MRYYYSIEDKGKKIVKVSMIDTTRSYGFEYYGN